MKSINTTVNLEIPRELKEKLKIEAENREMSISGLIRLIIKEYFNNVK